jgi:large subunit ribosomal protein L1
MKKHSKRYLAAKATVEEGKELALDEALKLLQSQAKPKFDAGVEIHIKLGIDPKKADQIVRGTVNLPHGTGKIIKVAAFVPVEMVEAVKAAGADLVGGEELVKQIKETGKTPFDIAVAHPTMMKGLGPIAKSLGQKGLMPNPRNETVTPKVAETVAALKKGKATFRSDDSGNVHMLIGRVSFPSEQLAANFQTFLDAIRKAKPVEMKGTYLVHVTVSSSMGPSVTVTV